EQRGRHLGVTEHARPLTEGEVGGNEDGGAFVERVDGGEEELPAGLGEGKISRLIEKAEVNGGEVISEPPLRSVAALGLEPIDEIDDVVEATAGAGADAASPDRDGEMGFAGAGAADQHGIALLGDEAASSEIA